MKKFRTVNFIPSYIKNKTLISLFYKLKLITFFFIASCANTQQDKILFQDSVSRVKVYQSDLSKYIFENQITDTAGKSKYFIKVLANAKARMNDQEMNISGSLKKPYNEILKDAKEFIDRKNLINKVLVIKHERKIYLLNDQKIIKTYNIDLGKNPVGQKEYEGDGRTPEGTYSLDWQKWNSTTFHSFHISYPNRTDSLRAIKRNLIPGSNIMIHGTSDGKKKKDWTNGCIALTNKDMLEFRNIVFQGTVIQIQK